mmetsp:Transcript_7097/g.17313  ORF Transcript_7097/g.17313 Transcript_7097/m.17313 type:complete len:234 (-) Transcript_7097:605-1306(-)
MEDDNCCYEETKNNDSRCVWMPYDDLWIQSAQFLSILAVFVSWTWWVTFVLSAIGMALMQTIWCFRQTRCNALLLATVASVCAGASLAFGVYVATEWSKHGRCAIFLGTTWNLDDDDPFEHDEWKHSDHCPEKRWAAVSVTCGLVWIAVAVCILVFVFGGRHAALEACYERNNGNGNNKKSESRNGGRRSDREKIPSEVVLETAAVAEAAPSVPPSTRRSVVPPEAPPEAAGP